MPAEWEPHRATWLAWPTNLDWAGHLEQVQTVWVEMVRELSLGETVRLLVDDEAAAREILSRLAAAGADPRRVALHATPTVDVWMRDYGATFITRPDVDAPLACIDWTFNAWGNKYPAYVRDDQVAPLMAQSLGAVCFHPGIVLEGGAIEVNGEGTCLTTEQCLLNPNRNPHLGREEIEQCLQDYLGVDGVIWLAGGLAGDDTDGHIDNLARFVNPTTVVCVLDDSAPEEERRTLRDNFDRLVSARDARGRKFTVIPLPLPGEIAWDGVKLPASYGNFYIGNETVLVPVYNRPNDAVALGILQELFPKRKVMGLPCIDMIYGVGAIHCVTQQEPLAYRAG